MADQPVPPGPPEVPGTGPWAALADLAAAAGRYTTEMAVLSLTARSLLWVTKYGYRLGSASGPPALDGPAPSEEARAGIVRCGRARLIADPRYYPRRLELTADGWARLALLLFEAGNALADGEETAGGERP